MTQNSKASTPDEIEKLNPLNEHYNQNMFYFPCKLLKERIESSKEKYSQIFFVKCMLQETLKEGKAYIKNQYLIPEMKNNENLPPETDIFEKFCQLTCDSVSNFQTKLFFETMATKEPMISDADGSGTLPQKWYEQSNTSILELENIFLAAFTHKGLSGLSFLKSWYCYGFIQTLHSVNEILLLKEVEEDLDHFQYEAEKQYKAMKLQFNESIYHALNILKQKSSS